MFNFNKKTLSIQEVWYLFSIPVHCVFRGYAQILLQEKILTGMLFCLAICVTAYELQRPEIFYYSICGATLSPILAWILGYSREEITRGIWGYNAILYSIAVSIFIPLSAQSHFFLIIGNIGIVLFTPLLSSVLGKLPVLTMPFIIATWGLCLVKGTHSGFSMVENSMFTLTPVDYAQSVINNYLEIFLLAGIKGGFLIMVGLFFSDKKIFIWSIIASCISTLVSCFDSRATLEQVVGGMYGYNVILTTVAIYTFAGLNKRINTFFLGAIVVTFLLDKILSLLLSHISLPLLTFPFVLSSWLFILAQKFHQNNGKMFIKSK
ncbi:TPA: urea transporter [Escherichia coli]|nr:urea transporter [Escherichia coli]HEL8550151.1 urea transporter [Escherichia coli]HEM0025823.1 urea transporter [Escherichia coli]